MDRDATLSPGSMLGPYRVLRRVGRGTFSEVYEALKAPLDRRVALKVLRADHAESAEALARFEREARLAASIDHPHVAKVLETGTIDGVRVHEMEFLDGPTLSAVIRSRGAMAVPAFCDLAVPLVSAVAALHDRGYVHRDLKPGNVILVERHRGVIEPVLIDFGIAKAPDGPSDAELTRTLALLGSPGYMSPEQARESRNLDARSDQFSLGIMLWEALTGRRLFEGDVLYKVLQRVAEEPIAPVRALRPEVPAEIDAALMRSLTRPVEARFESVRDLGRALLPFASPAVQERFRAELAGPATSGPRSFLHVESTVVTVRPGALLSTPPPAAIVASLPEAGAHTVDTLQPGAASQETLAPRDVPVRGIPHALPLSRGAAIGFGVLFVVAAVALFGGEPDAPRAAAPPAPVETYSVDVRAIPEAAAFTLDGREVGHGRVVWELPRDGRSHRLRASAPGYVPREVEFTDAPPTVTELVLVPTAPVAPLR